MLPAPQVLCFTMHGAFLRRQSQVSEQFAELLAQHFVNSANMWEEILLGTRKQEDGGAQEPLRRVGSAVVYRYRQGCFPATLSMAVRASVLRQRCAQG